MSNKKRKVDTNGSVNLNDEDEDEKENEDSAEYSPNKHISTNKMKFQIKMSN